MLTAVDQEAIAEKGAAAMVSAFDGYLARFASITRLAKRRFEARDWKGMQRDAALRLELYSRIVGRITSLVHDLFGDALHDKALWAAMRGRYARIIQGRPDTELAETFFNSLTRRTFATVGVDPAIEFVSPDFDAAEAVIHPCHVTYPAGPSLAEQIRRILEACVFAVPFANLDWDAQRVARVIDKVRRATGVTAAIDAIEIARPIFYRNKGAYLVGRIRSGEHTMPILLALHSDAEGITVDAVLLTEDEVSVVFSFTRSYFHVETDRPGDVVAFLRSIMPRKPLAELYTAIGQNKHGKTELYRDLMRHIERSKDRFEIARGERGMVMVVFTLPSYDVVFKVIRDHFAYPKTVTRAQVRQKYELVYKHDRAGRLADVQEFEHLAFPRERFSEDLLAELAAGAAQSIRIGPEFVDIRHLYTERRMIPLNLYLREADAEAAREAIIDYGQSVKDLATTNIFPGDMLLKNFGVTRHGRVVFYDYDEICPLTDCNFRDMPAVADEMAGSEDGPAFYVGPNDIFPEEFIRFLGLGQELEEVFLDTHGDLLTARYWRTMQERHKRGEIMDIIPYRPSRRLQTPAV